MSVESSRWGVPITSLSSACFPLLQPRAKWAPGPPFRARRLAVPLRKESKRGLIALAVLLAVGLGTFAAVGSSGALRQSTKDAVAERLKLAK